jgi:hypothetical protein
MMATKIYDVGIVELLDGREFLATPLKILYLREFMSSFALIKQANNDEEAITCLTYCARVAMKQYLPDINTLEEFEDLVDLPTVYKILDYAAGVKVDKDSKETVKDQAVDSGSSWDEMDLAKLEAEVFLLGIWKDYHELESSLSMPELVATLEAKRETDYNEKKFFAAIQGIDIDQQSGKQNAWEEMKARVFSGGQAKDANDILALQGQNAANAGFGIGNGLGYSRVQPGEQPFGGGKKSKNK